MIVRAMSCLLVFFYWPAFQFQPKTPSAPILWHLLRILAHKNINPSPPIQNSAKVVNRKMSPLPIGGREMVPALCPVAVGEPADEAVVVAPAGAPAGAPVGAVPIPSWAHAVTPP